jgi:regulator of RNase E activity RraA
LIVTATDSTADFFVPPDLDAYAAADAALFLGAVGGVIDGIRPQTAATRFAGRALTARVDYRPDELIPIEEYGGAELCARVQEGDVIVLDGGGLPLTVFGDLAVLATSLRQGRGVVLNARVRDIEDIEPIGLPVFATDVGMASVIRHARIVDIGSPLEIDGVRVETGDLITGCRGGVLVVPSADAAAVLARTQEVLDLDAVMRKALVSGRAFDGVWAEFKKS